MRLLGKALLEKLRRKNRGNRKLSDSIDQLIEDFEAHQWENYLELQGTRPDADRVHDDGFYFFDIAVHRTMILVEFEEQEATVLWAGNHQAYEKIFKNNKQTIKKWLKSRGYI